MNIGYCKLCPESKKYNKIKNSCVFSDSILQSNIELIHKVDVMSSNNLIRKHNIGNIPTSALDILVIFDYPSTEGLFFDNFVYSNKTIKKYIDEKLSGFKTLFINTCACSSNKPSSEEINNCFTNWVSNIINITEPKLILCLGASSVRTMQIKSKFKDIVGTIKKYTLPNIKNSISIAITLSPRSVLTETGANLLSVIKHHINNFVEQYKIDTGLSDEKEKIEDIISRYILSKDPDTTISFLENLLQCDLQNPKYWLAIDTETDSLKAYRPGGSHIITMSFAWREGEIQKSGAFLLDHPDFPIPEEKRNIIINLIRKVCISPCRKVFHGLSFDYQFISLLYKIEINNIMWDTLYAEHLINESKKGYYSLKQLAPVYEPAFGGYKSILGEDKIDTVEETSNSTKEDIGFVAKDIDKLLPYAAIDTDMTYKIMCKQLTKLRGTNRLRLLYTYIIPLAKQLGKMQFQGCKLDIEYVDQISKEITSVLVERKKEIFELLKTTIPSEILKKVNINSNPQLINIFLNYGYINSKGEKIIYTKDKFSKTEKNKNISIDEDSLINLIKFGCELSKLLLEYRKEAKVLSTYFKKYKGYGELDGRVHGEYDINGTATGRLNSKKPNLQNVPHFIRKYNVKKCIIPETDHVLVNADAKAAEVRILTLYCPDKNLIEGLNAGLDVHEFTASTVHSIPYDYIHNRNKRIEDYKKKLENKNLPPDTKLQDLIHEADRLSEIRRNIKRTVFGIMYGSMEYGLARELGISIKEAGDLLNLFLSKFPCIKEYMEETRKEVDRNKYVETIFGRRRNFDDLTSAHIKNRAYRQAVNFKIQSTTSDMVLMQLLQFIPIIENDMHGFIRLTVHDSIAISLPEKYVYQLPDMFWKEGSCYIKNKVNNLNKKEKLQVDFLWEIEKGKNYGELEEFNGNIQQSV